MDIARAVGRIQVDSIDDLWPDPAGLNDLPRPGTETKAYQAAVAHLRTPGAVQPAAELPVPKRDGLTRTGHSVQLPERVLYQALVDTFLHDVDKRMSSRDHVFGYRANNPRRSSRPFGKKPIQQWLAFHGTLKDVAAKGHGAVVETDVASFFEQIPHSGLEEQLRYLGVSPPTASELRVLLTKLMGGRSKGIPQGNDASSVLGSAYLTSVDRAVLKAYPHYFRYVDDIRIFTASEGEARKALRFLEAEVRKLDLNLQAGKTRILVGAAQIKREIIDADAEIDAIDYVWRVRPRRVSLPKVKKAWRSASRAKAWNKRLIKFLINRLRIAESDLALNWCLTRLGILDWLAELVAPYMALFVHRPTVQSRVETHLRSPANISAWEECALLRMYLSAPRIRPSVVDYALDQVRDRNANSAVRAWSAVLVGRFGDDADRALMRPFVADDEAIARSMLVAFQSSSTSRGLVVAQILAAYPRQKRLADRLKGAASPLWPTFPVW